MKTITLIESPEDLIEFLGQHPEAGVTFNGFGNSTYVTIQSPSYPAELLTYGVTSATIAHYLLRKCVNRNQVTMTEGQ